MQVGFSKRFPSQASSFLEIDQHAAVYRVILEILQEMSKDCHLVKLLDTLPHQNVSIHSLLQGIQAQVSYLFLPLTLLILNQFRQGS